MITRGEVGAGVGETGEEGWESPMSLSTEKYTDLMNPYIAYLKLI